MIMALPFLIFCAKGFSPGFTLVLDFFWANKAFAEHTEGFAGNETSKVPPKACLRRTEDLCGQSILVHSFAAVAAKAMARHLFESLRCLNYDRLDRVKNVCQENDLAQNRNRKGAKIPKEVPFVMTVLILRYRLFETTTA